MRDLGSDRGTWVNGARLSSGSDIRLSRGDMLRFGALTEEFHLIDVTPPRLSARRLTDRHLAESNGEELFLPSAQNPEVRVFKDEIGRWTMARGHHVHFVSNAELVVVGGQIYRLYLPSGLARRAYRSATELSIANVKFELRVSQDEEHVEIWLHKGLGETEILPARAHYYTLLVLARARLADRERELPLEARGWRSSPELSRMLAVDESSINVHVHRIRRDLETLGLVDANQIISRQRSRRLLRINSPKLEITKC